MHSAVSKIRHFTILSETDDRRGHTLTWTGEDVPTGSTPSRSSLDHDIGLQVNDFSASSVGSWCDSCVFATGDVSHLSEHLLASINVGAMSIGDWFAAVGCTYVFAVTMVGEIKDIELCEIAANRGRLEMSRRWRLALSFLNLFRAHAVVLSLVVCVPLVILSRGGGSLDVAFNTIAILFLTEVDNITYHLALSERAKQRVDEAGHVQLTDADEKKLSRTKPCCIAIILAGITLAIFKRSMATCFFYGFFIAWLCKASEVLSMQGSSATEKLIFLVRCFFCQLGGWGLMMTIGFAAEAGHL